MTDDTHDVELNYDKIVDSLGETHSFKEYLERCKASCAELPKECQNPVSLQFELTHKCNQGCLHCYNQSGMESNFKKDLPIEKWKELAREAGELGVFECTISGGEPLLLGDSLFEIMDIMSEYDVRFRLITNGMLVTQDVLDRLKKYRFKWLQVSIDGSRPELHDYVRGMDGAFRKAVSAARLVKMNGFPLLISHVVVKSNLDYIEEMIDTAYFLGAKAIVVVPFVYSGRAIINKDKLDMTSEEISDVFSRVSIKRKEYYKRMNVISSLEEQAVLQLNNVKTNSAMLIGPGGDVKIDCSMPFIIGNVLNNSIYEIWESVGKKVRDNEQIKEYLRSIKSSKDLLKPSFRNNIDKIKL
ncbi:radical SAM/SPASM domain-containing protein [Alphaproteobacteria bacterium]|nr:radical SAM/SPASM domain-containing protein [Alphaproteobacteria bacterium]